MYGDVVVRCFCLSFHLILLNLNVAFLLYDERNSVDALFLSLLSLSLLLVLLLLLSSLLLLLKVLPFYLIRVDLSVCRTIFTFLILGFKFRCQFCEKSFSTKKYLRKHVKTNYESERYFQFIYIYLVFIN